MGINHNVDELLAGCLTQIRLKKEHNLIQVSSAAIGINLVLCLAGAFDNICRAKVIICSKYSVGCRGWADVVCNFN